MTQLDSFIYSFVCLDTIFKCTITLKMIRCSKVSFLWLKASVVFVYSRLETGRHFGLSFQLPLIPYCLAALRNA